MVAAGAVVAPGTVVRSGEIWGGERWHACCLPSSHARPAAASAAVGGKASPRSSQWQWQWQPTLGEAARHLGAPIQRPAAPSRAALCFPRSPNPCRQPRCVPAQAEARGEHLPGGERGALCHPGGAAPCGDLQTTGPGGAREGAGSVRYLPGGLASLSFMMQAGGCLVPAAGASGSPAAPRQCLAPSSLHQPFPTCSSLPVHYCYNPKPAAVTAPFRHSSMQCGAGLSVGLGALLAPGPASRIMRLRPPSAAWRSNQHCDWGIVAGREQLCRL